MLIKIVLIVYAAICFLILILRVKELEKENEKWRDMYFELKYKELLMKPLNEKVKLNILESIEIIFSRKEGNFKSIFLNKRNKIRFILFPKKMRGLKIL